MINQKRQITDNKRPVIIVDPIVSRTAHLRGSRLGYELVGGLEFHNRRTPVATAMMSWGLMMAGAW